MAAKDTNFTAATVNYTWAVVPEPGTGALVAIAALFASAVRFASRKRNK